MSIRLVNGCVNCQNLEGQTCSVHQAVVTEKHTCDSFDMQPALFEEVDCMTCTKLNTGACPHPANAAKGMLCGEYAPEAVV